MLQKISMRILMNQGMEFTEQSRLKEIDHFNVDDHRPIRLLEKHGERRHGSEKQHQTTLTDDAGAGQRH